MRKLPFLAALLAFGVVASASDTCVITKSTGEQPGQNYTLRVYDADNNIVYYDEATSGADGNVEFNFVFGQTSGSYEYSIKSETGLTLDDTLDYIDPDEYTDAFAKLKADCTAKDAAAVEADLLTTYANVFQVEKGFTLNDNIKALGSLSTAMQGFIADINATSSPVVSDVKNFYKKNMLLFAVSKGSNDLIVKADTEYGELLGLTDEAVNKYYDALDNTAKLNVASIERGTYSTTEEYSAVHTKAVALAGMNAASQYTEIGNIIDELAEGAGLSSLPTSITKTQRANILQALAKLTPFTSASDYEAKLKKAESTTTTKESTTKSTGGGGGGGGGSVSVTTTDDTVSTTDTLLNWITSPFSIKNKTSVISTIKGFIK